MGTPLKNLCSSNDQKTLAHSSYHILYQPKGVPNFSGTGGYLNLMNLLPTPWMVLYRNSFAQNTLMVTQKDLDKGHLISKGLFAVFI